jgi:ubiquitin-like protein Pup
MSDQIQKKPPAPKEEQTKSAEPKTKKNEELAAETDALLDEIDQVLEETLGDQTAEQFCQSYIQRGGQ